jgi:hypothetical protein
MGIPVGVKGRVRLRITFHALREGRRIRPSPLGACRRTLGRGTGPVHGQPRLRKTVPGWTRQRHRFRRGIPSAPHRERALRLGIDPGEGDVVGRYSRSIRFRSHPGSHAHAQFQFTSRFQFHSQSIQRIRHRSTRSPSPAGRSARGGGEVPDNVRNDRRKQDESKCFPGGAFRHGWLALRPQARPRARSVPHPVRTGSSLGRARSFGRSGPLDSGRFVPSTPRAPVPSGRRARVGWIVGLT